jgi:pimeloyl-ACP methyl ester carboxylesterase
MLGTAEVDIAYDVHGPLPTADGRPPLFMIGQPMDASGFGVLASHFPDRTVVTYDPRGLGRSTRKDGRVDNAPTVQADDVHSVIEALGVGPVEMFASSGGAVTALALVAAYPSDVTTLVAHEPPLIPVLPDAEAAERARAAVRDAYEAKGSNAGMAAFIAMTSWRGEFTDDYFTQPEPDLVMFGMPTDDDGSRDDPLLSDRSWAVSSYRLGADARRDRRGRGVPGHLHRTDVAGHRRAAQSAGDRVPEPPRRLPRRRVRIRRPARGLRAQTARRPRRRQLTHRTSRFRGGRRRPADPVTSPCWAN